MICQACCIDKDPSVFQTNTSRVCNECIKEGLKPIALPKPKANKLPKATNLKTCQRCLAEKLNIEFQTDKSHYCNNCIKAVGKADLIAPSPINMALPKAS